MYRTVTYGCLKDHVNLKDESQCAEVARNVTLAFDENQKQRMFYKGEDVSDYIRTKEINTNINFVCILLILIIFNCILDQ
jgi:cytidylate kinase